jgi:hypothetical protein
MPGEETDAAQELGFQQEHVMRVLNDELAKLGRDDAVAAALEKLHAEF